MIVHFTILVVVFLSAYTEMVLFLNCCCRRCHRHRHHRRHHRRERKKEQHHLRYPASSSDNKYNTECSTLFCCWCWYIVSTITMSSRHSQNYPSSTCRSVVLVLVPPISFWTFPSLLRVVAILFLFVFFFFLILLPVPVLLLLLRIMELIFKWIRTHLFRRPNVVIHLFVMFLSTGTVLINCDDQFSSY